MRGVGSTYFCVGIAPGSALAQRQTRRANERHDQLQRVLIVAELQLQPPLDGYRLRCYAHAMVRHVRVRVLRMRVCWMRMRMRMRMRQGMRVRWR